MAGNGGFRQSSTDGRTWDDASDKGQAITVSESGRPVGIVTRADLLESLVT